MECVFYISGIKKNISDMCIIMHLTNKCTAAIFQNICFKKNYIGDNIKNTRIQIHVFFKINYTEYLYLNYGSISCYLINPSAK